MSEPDHLVSKGCRPSQASGQRGAGDVGARYRPVLLLGRVMSGVNVCRWPAPTMYCLPALCCLSLIKVIMPITSLLSGFTLPNVIPQH